MKKIKDFLKCYLPGFILGIISVSIITVYAETFFPSNQTTYDNTNTELKSENVQDAIDELYGVCFPSAGDQIIKDNNLEKDEYECRYFFTGAKPNNYITFNNESWRIISVECDKTIKITKNTVIDSMKWDNVFGTDGNNNWARPSTLNTYLNEEYYKNLTDIAKSQIVAKNWSIGAVTYNNNNIKTQINNENSNKWHGKIGLITASEFIRANSNKEYCGSFNGWPETCNNTNWQHLGIAWWLLTPSDKNDSTVFYIYNRGYIYERYAGENALIRPALYLNSKIKIEGTGTESDPYTIE